VGGGRDHRRPAARPRGRLPDEHGRLLAACWSGEGGDFKRRRRL
jgi:hypothetical protein